MKRTSKILLSTILLAIISFSCSKTETRPYVRVFYSVDGKEYNYIHRHNMDILLPFSNDDYWDTSLWVEQDSVAYFSFIGYKLHLGIYSDTTCFINGKKYYYEEESMRYAPNFMTSTLEEITGKHFSSGSFEFHLMEKDESIDFWDYFVLFYTRWVDKEVSDTIIFNGRIEIFAREGDYRKNRNYILSR